MLFRLRDPAAVWHPLGARATAEPMRSPEEGRVRAEPAVFDLSRWGCAYSVDYVDAVASGLGGPVTVGGQGPAVAGVSRPRGGARAGQGDGRGGGVSAGRPVGVGDRAR